MGESHKRFLQTMMSNGIISSVQAKALHRHCCETHGGVCDIDCGEISRHLYCISYLKTHVNKVDFLCRWSVAHFSPDRLEEFIDVINASLQPMFMHIRKGTSEEDGAQHYALVGDYSVYPPREMNLMNSLGKRFFFLLHAGEHGQNGHHENVFWLRR